jgi:hydroxyacylglutathione hydrolase
MPHSITVQPRPMTSKSGQFKVHQVPAAADNVIWLIEYRPGECAAVDGPSAKEVLDYCQQHNLTLTTILNTHTHADHIGINRDLGRQNLVQNLRIIGAAMRQDDIPFITEAVTDQDNVTIGDLTGEVWLTEGHIDGHICYLFEEFLFCGDTLFAGGCGYLFDGPPSKMHDSLQRLATLPSDTYVCCAHEYTQDNLRFAYSLEPNNDKLRERMSDIWKKRSRGESSLPSTIGIEVATNPFIRVHSPELKNALKRQYPDIDSVTDEVIFSRTRQTKDSRVYRSLSDPSFLS